MKPLFLVLSAPSGGGKTTLCDLLLQHYPEFCYSVSCTTREPRIDEEDGVDYYFLPMETFKRMIAEDRFLEYATVHDHYYGTLKEPVYDTLREGQCMLLDIDVEGAHQIRTHVAGLPADNPLRQGYVDLFINPPSLEVLTERLQGRATDRQEVIEKRIRNAQAEIARANEYMYQVTNDDLKTTFRRICDIINVRAGFI
ncbi:MAG TPA: guanylate kinase [Kiritimatiellia bacterium]|jgi:guanylate kinase|nr:guanylate kinase [Kiritimatiellia bacterium]HOR98208.1 guanylate kinase [Kiritimatiellia bacterium]HPK38104.1 guanylate kinase [Kiritimatiellia bacterium]